MGVMANKANEVGSGRVLPQTLAGATVLQIVPAVHDNELARTTLDIARALVHAGARSIVGGERGALVDELKSFGGEWLPLRSATLNPFWRRRDAGRLAAFAARERIDIIHAKSVATARSASTAPTKARRVTDLPDLPQARMRRAALHRGALAGGDRVIARSLFHAQPMIDRHRIPADRVSVIPRSIDAAVFD